MSNSRPRAFLRKFLESSTHEFSPFFFQDIRHALPDLGGIVSVAIETNEGRYKASARLTMEYPEVLDDWPDSRQTVFVKNKEVSVCVGNSGMVTNTNAFLFFS